MSSSPSRPSLSAIVLACLALGAAVGAGFDLPLDLLVGQLLALGIVALFLGVSWGLGRPLATRLVGGDAGGVLLHAWALAIGLALQTLVVWIFGEIAAPPSRALSVVFLLEALVVFLSLRGELSEASVRHAAARVSGAIPATQGLLALLLLLPLAAFWFVPPFSYDVLEYHLAGPLGWRTSGSTAPLAGNFYTGLPSAVEFQYRFLLELARRDGFMAAKLLHGAYLGFFVALAMELWRGLGLGRATRWTALVLLLAYQPLFQTAVDANNDLGAAALFTLALLTWLRLRSPGATGLALGLAAGCKFSIWSMGIAAMVPFVLLAPAPPRDSPKPVSSPLRVGLILVASFLAAYLPWMIRGLRYFGEPLFPLTTGLGGILGYDPVAWSPLQAAAYAAHHHQAMPWEGVYWARLPEQLMRLGWLAGGALVAATALLTLVRCDARRAAGATLLATLAGLAAWNLLGTSPTRFVLPLLPLLFGALLLGVEGLRRAEPLDQGMAGRTDDHVADRYRCALTALALIVAVPTGVRYALTVDSLDVVKVALGQESGAAFIEQSAQGWKEAGVFQYFAKTKGVPRVLCLFETRTAALTSYDPATVTVHDAIPRQWRSLADLAAAGFDHVLINELEAERLAAFYPVDAIYAAAGVAAAPPAASTAPSDPAFAYRWGPAVISGLLDGRSPDRLRDAVPLLGELWAWRDRADWSSGDLTPSGHRVWILWLRRFRE